MAQATGALAPTGGVDCEGDGVIDVAAGAPLVCAISASGPGFGQAESSVGIFRVVKGKGEALRTTVALGRASVNTIEVKGGLSIGDSVIISDMSQFDATNRVRIK